MSLGLDKVNAIGDLLTLREIVIRSVSELNRNYIRNVLEFVCSNLFRIDINLCIGEGAQLS